LCCAHHFGASIAENDFSTGFGRYNKMQEALIALVFLIAAGLIGRFLAPTEEQTKPLIPQASSGDTGHDHHGH